MLPKSPRVHVLCMTSNPLCLNPSKTEFKFIGRRDQLNKIPDPLTSLNLDFASTHIIIYCKLSCPRLICICFTKPYSFSDHVTHLSCFMPHAHRELHRIRPICSIS